MRNGMSKKDIFTRRFGSTHKRRTDIAGMTFGKWL